MPSSGYAVTEVETRIKKITRQEKTDAVSTTGREIMGTFEAFRLKIAGDLKSVPRISIVDTFRLIICAVNHVIMHSRWLKKHQTIGVAWSTKV